MGVTRAAEVRSVKKDWGYEVWIVNNEQYCGKKLVLKRGWQCSLHHHKIKHETFSVVEGKVRLELRGQFYVLFKGDVV